MKRKVLSLLSLILVSIALGGGPAAAQGPLPPSYPLDVRPGQIRVRGPMGATSIVESDAHGQLPSKVTATGGPDQFGYTWDSSGPFAWIDATGGTNTGMNGTYQYSGPIGLPFAFKNYENSYSQIYISSHGILGFDNLVASHGQQSGIPDPTPPNNVIAPYWAPEDPSTGAIFYAQGGVTPNRYFVAEWYQVRDYTASSRLTFEAVLYESGDILFQYQTMNLGSSRWALSIGIEDAYGADGLRYSNSPQPNGRAVRFTRPAPSARMAISPLSAGRFTTVGTTESFQFTVRNTGDFGVDTFDLISTSSWPLALYAADGSTLLSDSNGSGYPDTGGVAPGATATFLAKIQVPLTLNVGDADNATILVRSANNLGIFKTIYLAVASPAPFAQSFRDRIDGAMSLYLVQPSAQTVKKATADSYYGSDPSVLELPGGNFMYAWDLNRCLDFNCNVSVADIEYTLLNNGGNTVRAVTKLTDHSGSSSDIYDVVPVLAVAPNGRIGVLWYQFTIDAGSHFTYNMYFAILDAGGNLIYGPSNLTGNSIASSPSFYSPLIAATADNHFVLSWERYDSPSTSNAWYAARDSDGNVVRSPGMLTSDGGSYLHSLSRASGNGAIFTWLRPWDIYYAVIDSAGNVSKGETNLSNDGAGRWSSDATVLSNGNIVVAWTNYDGIYPNLDQMAFAVLDGSYNLLSGPTALDNPAALNGNNYVTVVPDQSGHAILGWMDASNVHHLYYALVDGNGAVPTPPMIMRSSLSNAALSITYTPYGLATYHQNSTSTMVDIGISSPTISGGAPGGVAAIPLNIGNSGLSVANSVVVSATLDSSLSYVSASPPPSSITTRPQRPSSQLVRWTLPSTGFLGASRIRLNVGVPNTAIGTLYPVNWLLTSAGPEANPGNNTSGTNVLVAAQNFVPLIMR